MSLYHPVKIGSLELSGNLFLAPVAGYTDRAFRSLCAEEGACFSFTELVSAEALCRSPERYAIQLIGAGVRNWGFIDKAHDIARDNPQFLPANFSAANFSAAVRDFEEVRQLAFTLDQFLQMVNECLLIRGDALYRMALRIYGGLREQARNRVPGAETLFQALLNFFRRRRRPGETGEEPTEKELERDFHRLLHGTADGEIVIKNETPHASGGVHEVVDNVHTGHAAVKETIQGSEKE